MSVRIAEVSAASALLSPIFAAPACPPAPETVAPPAKGASLNIHDTGAARLRVAP